MTLPDFTPRLLALQARVKLTEYLLNRAAAELPDGPTKERIVKYLETKP